MLLTIFFQNLTALIGDLKAVGKKVYFWNFRKEAFNVMARYDRENVKLFKKGKSLEDVVGNNEEVLTGNDKC